MQRPARDEFSREAGQVGAVDCRQALQRAAGWLTIGVVRKRARAPLSAGERGRVIGVATEPRADLFANSDDRLLVEPRRIDREAQKLGGAIDVLDQGSHAAAEIIAVAIEGDFDRLFVERALVGLRIKIASALVKQARQHGRRPGLAGWVLRG